MTLIFEKKVAGPATHVILIGVGDYTYLPPAGRLTSPPHSARVLAGWFLGKHRNPMKKLGSLELLISDAENTEFELQDDKAIQVEKADMANTKLAIRRWIDRGNERADNQLVFYFCGHGIAAGPITVLLLDNYGEREDAMLENTINFRGLHSGMEMCKAREQCFFIDACRQISEKLIAHVAAGSFGDSIIDSSARLSQFGMRYAPVYYSTATGQGSYGRQGKASVFADALVKAMDGAGSDNFEGESRIYTNSLNRGIEFLIKYVMDDAINLLQRVQIDGLDGFPIHYLDAKPIIPVTVHCEPKEANKEARLSYSNQDGSSKGSRPSPEESDWDVDLEPGSYRFSATFTEGKYRDSYTDDYVNPPGHKIPIKVKE